MPDINRTLLDNIFRDSCYLSEYGCYRDDFENLFLRRRFIQRQKEAIKIIENILTSHGKKELLKHVSELAKIEYGIKELQPWQRDHVVHATLSFILGIYLNNNFMLHVLNKEVEPFQWKLAALLHDVGYPIQIAKDLMIPCSEMINGIKRELGIESEDVFFQIRPVNLDNLQNEKNSFALIQEQLNKWDLEIDAREEYEKRLNSGQVCHGMISALCVLYVIDLMYQSHNSEREYRRKSISNIDWNQKYFDEDVIPVCTAIFIHNLDEAGFQRTKIDPGKAPLAYLLKLTDVLQEWERPSLKNKYGYGADKFDIKIENRELIFTANIPENRKEKLKNELYSCLEADNIRLE